jgi:hypothetical protein
VKPIIVYKASYGLNTYEDPIDLAVMDKYDRIYFTENVNFIVRPNGRVERRFGYSQLASGNFSLISKTTPTVGVVDGNLCIINSDGTTKYLRDSEQSKYISYIKFMDMIYYSSDVINGIIHDGNNYTWEASEYNGPDTDKQFETVVPIGSLLELHSGRMLIGKEDMLIVSELFDFGLYELDQGTFLFETDLTMIASVNKGIWIGTNDGLYWIQGDNPSDWIPIKISDDIPITGTNCKIPAHRFGLADIIPSGEGHIIYTNNGISIIGDKGFYLNTFEKKIDVKKNPWMFRAKYGSAIIYGDYYLVTLEV